MTGETLAEAAERQLQNHTCLIINFIDSDFDTQIAVLKNEKHETVLNAVENKESWNTWLAENKIKRIFNKNNKHGENGTGAHKSHGGNPVAILYCSIDEAQELLDAAINSPNPNDKRLYNFDEERDRKSVV